MYGLCAPGARGVPGGLEGALTLPAAFATAETAALSDGRGRRPAVPAQAPLRGAKSRFVHRKSPRDFNALSPGNFDAAVLFPCATQAPLRPFPYRKGVARQPGGAKASGALAGRYRDFGTGSIRKGSGTSARASQGSERQRFFGTGATWAGKPSRAERARKASGSVPRGRAARTASEHLAPFPGPAALFACAETKRGPPAIGNRAPRTSTNALPRLCTCTRANTRRPTQDQLDIARHASEAPRCDKTTTFLWAYSAVSSRLTI